MLKKIITSLLIFSCATAAQVGERLVVAGGSLTELVYALGDGAQVVAVDETTSWPPETAALPHIGYWKQLSSEGILSLKPSRFITWRDAGPQVVLEQLVASNIEVVTLPRTPATVEQMYANIQRLAQVLQVPNKGVLLVTQVRQRLAKIARSNADKPAAIRAMFILSAGGGAPQIAGKGSVADAILTLAGAQNVAQHAQYRSYSAESIIAANPEVIVVTTQMMQNGLAPVRTIAGITRTQAWKNGRIIALDQALILGMGPRIADAVEQLHDQF